MNPTSARMVTPRRLALVLGAGLAAVVLCILICPLIGPSTLSLRRAFAGEWPDSQMFFGVRLPRVLLALLCGGALSIAGALFQALLRDALATPYTLGVSSGASLGAVVAICFGLHTVAGLPAVWGAALAGAGVTLLLVLGVASEGRRLSSFTLLLAGVMINGVVTSLIMLLHNLASVRESFAIVHWLMGNIDPPETGTLIALTLIVLPISVAICLYARRWNLMAVGEEWAASRGASPARLLLIGYIAGSLLTASVTAVTGPIGFVGLVVPHALRLKLGSDHRLLMPASFLFGAAFLALCDTAARTLFAIELPVSVLTALIGGPCFIALLRHRRRGVVL
jgi:iron complex transport system permease protein